MALKQNTLPTAGNKCYFYYAWICVFLFLLSQNIICLFYIYAFVCFIFIQVFFSFSDNISIAKTKHTVIPFYTAVMFSVSQHYNINNDVEKNTSVVLGGYFTTNSQSYTVVPIYAAVMFF